MSLRILDIFGTAPLAPDALPSHCHKLSDQLDRPPYAIPLL